MQEPLFWTDLERAQSITAQEKGIKDKIGKYNSLKNKIEDNLVLLELVSEEPDDNELNSILKDIRDTSKEIEDFKTLILLSGEYDKNNAVITLHAGAGGTDAQDWTDMLLRMYIRWSEKMGYKVETLDYIAGDEAGVKSVTLKISGEYAYGYLNAEKGIHRLVRLSPFNANNKRQTSFASMEVLPELTPDQDIDIRTEDLRIDTYRASGAGGQYVNKTESAIRITHIPTGIVVQCQNERSQHSNKEEALKMLKGKLAALKERAHKERIEDLVGIQLDNGFGSQIRSYVFHPYSMVKDHRTGYETSDVSGVMDGNINDFIREYLSGKSKNEG